MPVKRHKLTPWAGWILTLLLAVANPAVATQQNLSLAELENSGRLHVKTWLEPGSNIVVKQQIVLNIEVSTDTWFSAGTRIGRLELDGAVILRRQNFAVNSTRREGGKTFTVQVWSITLYPQRPGHFELPPLALTLSVAGDDSKAVVGEVMTPAIGFDVELPAGLQNQLSWISGRNFRVEESYNRDLGALKPGDAVQRQITFTAESMAAMMLPELVVDEQQGLAVYQKPSKLKDDNNRGAYLARRTEAITYLIEKPGRYQLPARTYYWWDLDSNSLQQATLPAQILDASAGTANGEQPIEAETTAPKSSTRTLWLTAVVAAVLLLVAGLLWRKWRQHQSVQAKTRPRASEQQLQQQMQSALQQRDWQQLVQTLYHWLDNYGGDQFDGSIRDLLEQLQQHSSQQSLDQLMLAAYYAGEADDTDIETFIGNLREAVTQQHESPWWQPPPISLTLN
jgi:hypothetical protein